MKKLGWALWILFVAVSGYWLLGYPRASRLVNGLILAYAVCVGIWLIWRTQRGR